MPLSEWNTFKVEPLSEFGQEIAPASLRGASITFICLIDVGRKYGYHLMSTMHTERRFWIVWQKADTFLEKCEEEKNYLRIPKRNFHIKITY